MLEERIMVWLPFILINPSPHEAVSKYNLTTENTEECTEITELKVLVIKPL